MFALQMYLSKGARCRMCSSSELFRLINILRVGIKYVIILKYEYIHSNCEKWAWHRISQSPHFDRCIRHAKMIQTGQQGVARNQLEAKVSNSAFFFGILQKHHNFTLSTKASNFLSLIILYSRTFSSHVAPSNKILK